MSDPQIYLVLVDVTLSLDGGHLSIKHEQYWVNAPNKRAAAAYCARYANKAFSAVAGKVIRVLAHDEWGKVYFPVINAFE